MDCLYGYCWRMKDITKGNEEKGDSRLHRNLFIASFWIPISRTHKNRWKVEMEVIWWFAVYLCTEEIWGNKHTKKTLFQNWVSDFFLLQACTAWMEWNEFSKQCTTDTPTNPISSNGICAPIAHAMLWKFTPPCPISVFLLPKYLKSLHTLGITLQLKKITRSGFKFPEAPPVSTFKESWNNGNNLYYH